MLRINVSFTKHPELSSFYKRLKEKFCKFSVHKVAFIFSGEAVCELLFLGYKHDNLYMNLATDAYEKFTGFTQLPNLNVCKTTV
jgi:hypothetical protein